MDSYFAVTPVFVLKASSTFWKLSCSLAPQSDITLIVLPDAPVPGAFPPPDEQAVATRSATSETIARDRGNRSIPNPLCGRRRPVPPRILLTCATGGSPRTRLARLTETSRAHDPHEQDVDERRGDADLRRRGDDAEAKGCPECEHADGLRVCHRRLQRGGHEIPRERSKPRERREDEDRDEQVRDERQNLIDDGAHRGELDGIRGHENDNEPQVPLHDARDDAGGIGADLRALEDARDAGAIGGGVDAHSAQRLSESSSEGAGDDPAEQQDDQSAEDRWDRGNESRESGGEAGQQGGGEIGDGGGHMTPLSLRI